MQLGERAKQLGAEWKALPAAERSAHHHQAALARADALPATPAPDALAPDAPAPAPDAGAAPRRATAEPLAEATKTGLGSKRWRGAEPPAARSDPLMAGRTFRMPLSPKTEKLLEKLDPDLRPDGKPDDKPSRHRLAPPAGMNLLFNCVSSNFDVLSGDRVDTLPEALAFELKAVREHEKQRTAAGRPAASMTVPQPSMLSS